MEAGEGRKDSGGWVEEGMKMYGRMVGEGLTKRDELI